jgi:hypothetical protein
MKNKFIFLAITLLGITYAANSLAFVPTRKPERCMDHDAV